MGLNRVKTETKCSKFTKIFTCFSPRVAAGGCSPLKATPGRGHAVRRKFFGILVIPIEKLMIFINILMFFQSDSVLFSVTHQGVLHVKQQIPTLKFYFESRITFGKCRVSYIICIVLPNHQSPRGQEGTTYGRFDHLSTKNPTEGRC